MDFDSGIISLGGYAYQILVFVSLLADIRETDSVGFEFIDDINITSANIQTKLDTNSEVISTLINNNSSIIIIQVKKTELDKAELKKVWYNWLIEYKKHNNISEFILYYDFMLNTKTVDLNVIPADELYKSIVESKKTRKNALSVQLKNLYSNFSEFEKAYSEISRICRSERLIDIYQTLYEKYKSQFHWNNNIDITYRLRISELCKIITGNILKSVLNRKAYLCKYEEFNSIIEDIVRRVKPDEYLPVYSTFRSTAILDLKDDKVINSREYRQLSYCSLSPTNIINLLQSEMYYDDYSLRLLSCLLSAKVDNIETTAYENYIEVVDDLKYREKDTPHSRLQETIDKDNSYAVDPQIKKGVCIHLTSESVDSDRQISWKEEKNE